MKRKALNNEAKTKSKTNTGGNALSFFRIELTLAFGGVLGVVAFKAIGPEALGVWWEAVWSGSGALASELSRGLTPTRLGIFVVAAACFTGLWFRMRTFLLRGRSDVPTLCPECGRGICRVRSMRYHKWLQRLFSVAIRRYHCRACSFWVAVWRQKLDSWPMTDANGDHMEAGRRRRTQRAA